MSTEVLSMLIQINARSVIDLYKPFCSVAEGENGKFCFIFFRLYDTFKIIAPEIGFVKLFCEHFVNYQNPLLSLS